MYNIDAIVHNVKSVLETFEQVKYRLNKKPLILYGAGNAGRQLCNELRKSGINPVMFCESGERGNIGKIVDGLPCVCIKNLMEKRKDITIMIATGYVDECMRNLKKMGFDDIVSFISIWSISHLQTVATLSSNIEYEINELLNLCADDESRRIAVTALAALTAIVYDIESVKSMCSMPAYLPDCFDFTGKQYIADVGAFTGDSTMQFRKYMPDCKIYAIEMEKSNFDLLCKNVRGTDTECFNVAICDKDGEICYTSCGSGSSIEQLHLNDNRVRTTTIDRLLHDKVVTYLKADIEGAEMDMLRGAQDIIKGQKPKCAICVYHNPKHFFEVPRYLKALVPEYRIYFRHHSEQIYETVCYASL